MSPLREIWIIFGRELRKNFRSIRGLILLVISIIGGGLATFAMSELGAAWREGVMKRVAERNLPYDETVTEAKRLALTWWFFDADTARHVAPAPLLLVALFSVSLWLVPAVILVLGFDSVAGDVQHRTVRYWALRSRRASFVVSKFLSLWFTCSAVALAMHVLMWGIVIFRGDATFGSTVAWGFRFWLASLPIIGVWCATSVLVSTLLRSPIIALLLNGGIFSLWWLFHLPFWFRSYGAVPADIDDNFVPSPSAGLYLFPNFYDRYLLSPQVTQALLGLTVTLGFAACCVAASSVLFAKRDL